MGVAREIVRSLAGKPPGTMLPGEADMVEQYGASRSSVREALRILEAQGLIMIRPGPGGGPILIGPQSDALGKTQSLFFHLLGARYVDLLTAQAALEPMLARLAAQNPDREQVEPLRQYAGLNLDDVATDEAYSRLAFAFHSAVAAASGNPVLSLLAESVGDILAARLGGHSMTGPSRRQAMIDIHSAVALAILDSNAELAGSLMASHAADRCARISADQSGLINEPIDWH